ncbi:putative endopeptidase [Kitasatospora sp. MAA4]|uniref:M13 family metallopeptidase n=1 Tax=Kitasatospora sp. MAA4 TaxID=3035093 RepID=UPI0024743114|nr:M13 family metallopeptidase [Kitasatospora sp. MAA4]MDH6132945.1 putative endopeptidase [Kitasatospora sp. MAA4]
MTVASDLAPAPAGQPGDLELDPAIRPQDDFYRYVNGRWSQAYVLPAHRAEATTLTLLADKVQDDAEAVIRRTVDEHTADRTPASRQIADLHASFMDEDRIERLGTTALDAGLAAIRSAADPAELAGAMGRLQAQGIGGALDFSVAVDTADADEYVLVLSQAGLGLPPAAYRSDEGRPLRTQYAEHMTVMLTHAGLPDPATAARELLRLETELAHLHTLPAAGTRPEQPLASTVARLASRTPGFPWAAWLRGLGDVPSQATVRVRQPGFPDALDAWWSSHSLDELKLWLSWRYVHEMVPFGPREVFADNFAFYGRTLKGFTEPRPRWMRAISFVETFAGDAVADRYLAQHLAPGTVEAVTELADALRSSFRERLERAEWMAPITRAAALEKLDSMVFEIGHPRSRAVQHEQWVDPTDLMGNVTRGRALHLAGQLARLGRPVDRSEWKVHPHQVTAYYRHGLNQVVIPAGLLQPPVFDPAGDPARNFAVLGAIIGHEMSHAFDARGSRYDGRGRLRNWWTPEDRAEFTRRTQLLIDQYDRYEPEGQGGRKVSGARTVGENMADVAGVTVAHTAFTRHTGSDPEQTRRFFVHWASMWRAKTTPERMAQRLASDRHPPAEFRCNGVLSHVAAFYDAFHLTSGDGLFLDPESRFSLL